MISKNTLYSQLQQLQSQKHYSQNYNITWNQGILLSTIIQTIKPKTILELGTSNGFSTLWMLHGNLQTTITTIEIDEKKAQQAQEIFKKTGCEKQIIVENQDCKKFIKNNKNEYDLIFIDTLQKEYVHLLDSCIQFISKRGYIIFDNFDSHQKTELLDYVSQNNLEYLHYKIGSGLFIVYQHK